MTKTLSQTTDVFDFLDYREFLKKHAAELKQKNRLTLRQFASKAGIKAPGYLKMVIEARRNLSHKTAQQFAKALRLNEKEADYFVTLVRYNQTTHPDQKKKDFEKLNKLLPRSRTFLKEKKENRYFSRPYYACIREMVALSDFKDDPKWIARRCIPPISPGQAREAINTLLDLGLLKRNQDGRLVQTESFVHTNDKNTQAIETYHYHQAMLDKACVALGELPQEQRNYYALTLPLTKELFHEIIDDFYEFRDRMVKKANECRRTPDEVYQINFQLFPVTRKRKDPEEKGGTAP